MVFFEEFDCHCVELDGFDQLYYTNVHLSITRAAITAIIKISSKKDLGMRESNLCKQASKYTWGLCYKTLRRDLQEYLQRNMDKLACFQTSNESNGHAWIS